MNLQIFYNIQNNYHTFLMVINQQAFLNDKFKIL
ncbi:hypothetical protein ZPR_0789 [Zunongwangia profunda SM-A87]|uniref:Uncharacterized protein n=1 Tax=Zunongwangia profunda (strain DSM 18752 / CCTCC AB 206139 / SM-A87) TaxID=655815 RepID=D5BGI0_ZUNPS|nr:hypothetical protein ZPR_0789 [Zunongwangia profunda SM-A87]